jgi:hypothetical protein
LGQQSSGKLNPTGGRSGKILSFSKDDIEIFPGQLFKIRREATASDGAKGGWDIAWFGVAGALL